MPITQFCFFRYLRSYFSIPDSCRGDGSRVDSRFPSPKPGRCLSKTLPKTGGIRWNAVSLVVCGGSKPPDRWSMSAGSPYCTAPSRSACGGHTPTSLLCAHSRSTADPSEIPLRPSQIRASRNEAKRTKKRLTYGL